MAEARLIEPISVEVLRLARAAYSRAAFCFNCCMRECLSCMLQAVGRWQQRLLLSDIYVVPVSIKPPQILLIKVQYFSGPGI